MNDTEHPDTPVSCPCGRADDRLHHADGSVRWTPASTRDGALEGHETALRIHLGIWDSGALLRRLGSLTAPESDAEHPDTQRAAICGVTVITEHFEFICVRAPHDNGERSGTRTTPRPTHSPQADRHYMVNRWPNRPPQERVSK